MRPVRSFAPPRRPAGALTAGGRAVAGVTSGSDECVSADLAGEPLYVMFGAVLGSPLCRSLGPGCGRAVVGAVAILAAVEVSHGAAAVRAGEASPIGLLPPDVLGWLAGATDGVASALFGPRRDGDKDRLVWAEGMAAGAQFLALSPCTLGAIDKVMSHIMAWSPGSASRYV